VTPEPRDAAGYLLAVPVQQFNGVGPEVASANERHELRRWSIGGGPCGALAIPDVSLAAGACVVYCRYGRRRAGADPLASPR
jgi:hypothetical protein